MAFSTYHTLNSLASKGASSAPGRSPIAKKPREAPYLCLYKVSEALTAEGHQKCQAQNCPQWDMESLWTQFQSSVIQVAEFIKTMYTSPSTQYIPDKWIRTRDAGDKQSLYKQNKKA